MKDNKKYTLVSLFTGAGGLDLGFKKAGFETVWANEYDKSIWATFEKNFVNVPLDKRSIVDIPNSDIPECDGMIGGPPCQSWSEAGAKRGINDPRGRLFYEYTRVIKDKKPKFFLAENVSGILAKRHSSSLLNIINEFKQIGYNISFELVNAHDFGVAQDRKRLIIVGFREDLDIKFDFYRPSCKKIYLKDILWDLPKAVPARDKNHSNKEKELFLNHEYFIGSYSTIYMSRNRVRSWDEPSFTIQAGGRHAPIHPQAPKMQNVGKDHFIFVKGKEDLYRRLSVRECARIQAFPDNYEFVYKNVSDGYKMIGNAVPVTLAFHLANQIMNHLNRNEIKDELYMSRQETFFELVQS